MKGINYPSKVVFSLCLVGTFARPGNLPNKISTGHQDPEVKIFPSDSPPVQSEISELDKEEEEKPVPYNFAFEVQDNSGNEFSHTSDSDGKKTEGEYRVLLPDGRTQIVKYRVDENGGYTADVTYETSKKAKSSQGVKSHALQQTNESLQQAHFASSTVLNQPETVNINLKSPFISQNVKSKTETQIFKEAQNNSPQNKSLVPEQVNFIAVQQKNAQQDKSNTIIKQTSQLQGQTNHQTASALKNSDFSSQIKASGISENGRQDLLQHFKIPGQIFNPDSQTKNVIAINKKGTGSPRTNKLALSQTFSSQNDSVETSKQTDQVPPQTHTGSTQSNTVVQQINQIQGQSNQQSPSGFKFSDFSTSSRIKASGISETGRQELVQHFKVPGQIYSTTAKIKNELPKNFKETASLTTDKKTLSQTFSSEDDSALTSKETHYVPSKTRIGLTQSKVAVKQINQSHGQSKLQSPSAFIIPDFSTETQVKASGISEIGRQELLQHFQVPGHIYSPTAAIKDQKTTDGLTTNKGTLQQPFSAQDGSSETTQQETQAPQKTHTGLTQINTVVKQTNQVHGQTRQQSPSTFKIPDFPIASQVKSSGISEKEQQELLQYFRVPGQIDSPQAQIKNQKETDGQLTNKKTLSQTFSAQDGSAETTQQETQAPQKTHSGLTHINTAVKQTNQVHGLTRQQSPSTFKIPDISTAPQVKTSGISEKEQQELLQYFRVPGQIYSPQAQIKNQKETGGLTTNKKNLSQTFSPSNQTFETPQKAVTGLSKSNTATTQTNQIHGHTNQQSISVLKNSPISSENEIKSSGISNSKQELLQHFKVPDQIYSPAAQIKEVLTKSQTETNSVTAKGKLSSQTFSSQKNSDKAAIQANTASDSSNTVIQQTNQLQSQVPEHFKTVINKPGNLFGVPVPASGALAQSDIVNGQNNKALQQANHFKSELSHSFEASKAPVQSVISSAQTSSKQQKETEEQNLATLVAANIPSQIYNAPQQTNLPPSPTKKEHEQTKQVKEQIRESSHQTIVSQKQNSGILENVLKGSINSFKAPSEQANAKPVDAFSNSDETCSCQQAPQPPAQPYEAPKQIYNEPEKFFQSPTQSHKAPVQIYKAPQQILQAPKQINKAPEQIAQVSKQIYQTPQQASQSPAQIYKAPEQIYKAPEQTSQGPVQIYKAPEQISQSPSQSYKAPEQIYKAPQQILQAPKQINKAPEQIAHVSKQIYQTPQQASQSPAQIYKAPEQIYKAPEQTSQGPVQIYKAPEQISQSPSQSYKAPEQIYKAPQQILQAPKQIKKVPEQIAHIPEQIKKTPQQASQSPAQIYKAPEQIYKAPQQTSQAPVQIYKAPEQIYNAPLQIFKVPEQISQAPEQIYKAPQQTFQAPAQTYKRPEQIKLVPAQVYKAPQQISQVSEQIKKVPEQIAHIPEQIKKTPQQASQSPAQIYKAPEQIYKAPQQTSQAPVQIYKEPEQIYNAPLQIFKVPEQISQAPEQIYKAPQQTFQAPAQTYKRPEQIKLVPAQVYKAPQQISQVSEQIADTPQQLSQTSEQIYKAPAQIYHGSNIQSAILEKKFTLFDQTSKQLISGSKESYRPPEPNSNVPANTYIAPSIRTSQVPEQKDVPPQQFGNVPADTFRTLETFSKTSNKCKTASDDTKNKSDINATPSKQIYKAPPGPVSSTPFKPSQQESSQQASAVVGPLIDSFNTPKPQSVYQPPQH